MIKIKLIEFQYFLSIIFSFFFFLNFRNFIVKGFHLDIPATESQKFLISNFIGNLLVTTDQF